MQNQNITQMAQAIQETEYETANLVLSGRRLGMGNLVPMSSIPVVIIRDQIQDCLTYL